MIQLIKNKPLTFRVQNTHYEFVKPKYLMPVNSLKLIEAKVKGSPWNMNDLKMIFKFKINGKEYLVEKELDRQEIQWDNHKEIQLIKDRLFDESKSIFLFYTLRSFVSVAFEQITGSKLPENLK